LLSPYSQRHMNKLGVSSSTQHIESDAKQTIVILGQAGQSNRKMLISQCFTQCCGHGCFKGKTPKDNQMSCGLHLLIRNPFLNYLYFCIRAKLDFVFVAYLQNWILHFFIRAKLIFYFLEFRVVVLVVFGLWV